MNSIYSGANPGWTFRNRPFAFAVALSLLWHFFWFFSISIVVTPKKKLFKTRPRIVSLGPVLDDTIFRTLVETKPQLSRAFYRDASDFSQVIEPKAQTIERHAPGEVVSVPFSRKFFTSLRDWVGGSKAFPELDLWPGSDDFRGMSREEIEELKKRKHRPHPSAGS
ncbi:MAG: hypothetical protein HYZ52_01885 [Candidatus Omnitrophica bacterium]|nr:hypothetical protein [Candidatus Omnitrophota bacterium]